MVNSADKCFLVMVKCLVCQQDKGVKVKWLEQVTQAVDTFISCEDCHNKSKKQTARDQKNA